jgi:hypothetical protein
MVDPSLFEDRSSNNKSRFPLGTITLCRRHDWQTIFKISQYTCFVVCVIAVQFVGRLRYGLEISKLVLVVVGRRPFIDATSIFDGLQTILG